MITREDIRQFLINQVGKEKDEVIMNFTQWALIAHSLPVDKIGKLLMDIRSYKEWTWGE